MGYQVDNAIIMAAGVASRFAPISYEKPKALIDIRGEILIERQIRQLREAGIKEIILVVGYRKEQFYYLKDKFGIIILENKEYITRNNHSSIYAAREYLNNSYICSSDNYFQKNLFEKEVDEAYYAALFSKGKTDEWCMTMDKDDYITDVKIGGENQWYMMGQVFWSEEFSNNFLKILEEVYMEESTKGKLWEDIYRENISRLKMKIKKYEEGSIFEFDSLDELRRFDGKYIDHSGSGIMQRLSEKLQCREGELMNLKPLKDENGESIGVYFSYKSRMYQYIYKYNKLNVM